MTAATEEAPRSIVDDILDAATRKYQDAKVFMDGAAFSEAEALRLQALEARQVEKAAAGQDDSAYDLHSPVPGIEAKLQEALDRLRASQVTFRFYALPANDYDALVDAHPSGNDDYGWDPETFPAALIASSCGMVRGPGVDADHLTLEEANRLEGGLDKPQWGTMLAAALAAQTRAAEPFTYAASGPTSGTDSKSTTAANKVSRIAGS